ncbi:MAG: hypothetical protein LBS85_03730 [Clostridiales Family XIII bacterium]|jgi:putative peptidoglycan lipid II flippase|nr:hypothetical protein [Clostridiales Family XIII bacterium]
MKTGSAKRSTGKNIVLTISASLLAKLMVLLQSSVISAVFGANADVDVMFYMMSLIISVTTFASAVNQLVLIANIIQAEMNGPAEAYRRLVRFLYTVYTGIGLVFAAAFFFFGKPLLLVLTAFDSAAIDRCLPLIRVMAAVVFLSVVNTYLMDLFTSFKIFVLPMVNDLIKSALIIGFVLLPAGRSSVTMVAWGMLAAYALQFVSIQFLFKRTSGFWLAFSAGNISLQARKNTFFVMVSQCATFIESMVIIGIVSTLPAGYFTAVTLARKLSVTVMNVLIVQFATVVGIDLIEYSHAGEEAKLERSFHKYLRAANYIILPVTAIIAVNAKPIISILFGYGKFTDDNIDIAAKALAVLALMLVTTLWDAFFQRLVVARQLQSKTWHFQVLQSAIRLVLIFFLNAAIGYLGIAVGLVLGNLIFVLMLGGWLFRHDYRFMRVAPTVKYTGINLVFAAAAAGLGVFALRFFETGRGFLENAVFLVLSSAVMLLVYAGLGLCYKGNRESLSALAALFRGKLRGGSR